MEKGAQVLPSLDPEIGQAHLDQAFDRIEVLRFAAPLISTVWLNDLLKKRLNPQPLELRNSCFDGSNGCIAPMTWAR